MKSMDLGCGVGSGRNSEDVFYVSATLNVGTIFCKVDTFQNGQGCNSNKRCFGTKPKWFRESGDFSGNRDTCFFFSGNT